MQAVWASRALRSATTRVGLAPRSASAATRSTSSTVSQNSPFSYFPGLSGAPNTSAAGSNKAPKSTSQPLRTRRSPRTENTHAIWVNATLTAQSLCGCGFPANRGRDRWAALSLVVAELERFDSPAALHHFLGRDQDLRDVLVGLPEVLLQVQHALAQPGHVLHQVADLGADLVRGLAHPRVLLDLLHDLDGKHQQGWRHQHDRRAVGLLDQVVEAVVQFGIDRLGRHEHQREVLRLARNEIALRDVGEVPGDVLAHAPRRDLALTLAARVVQRRDRLQRKLPVDDQRPLVVRQEDRGAAR